MTGQQARQMLIIVALLELIERRHRWLVRLFGKFMTQQAVVEVTDERVVRQRLAQGVETFDVTLLQCLQRTSELRTFDTITVILQVAGTGQAKLLRAVSLKG